MSKIVLLESLGISQEELAARQAPLEAQGHTFVSYPRTADPAALIQEARDADAVILANMPLPGSVIQACDKLKFIDVAFTGVDHIGLDAAKANGIAVSNAAGYSNEAVAELVLGMALSLSRHLTAVEQRCRTGGTKDGLVGFELAGKTVGIVGLGKIGSRTAELFHALGCPILAHSRTVHADAPAYVRQVSLEELLAQSDLVALHCPLNDSTRGHDQRRQTAADEAHRPAAQRRPGPRGGSPGPGRCPGQGHHRRGRGGRIRQGTAPGRQRTAAALQELSGDAPCGLRHPGEHDAAGRDRL